MADATDISTPTALPEAKTRLGRDRRVAQWDILRGQIKERHLVTSNEIALGDMFYGDGKGNILRLAPGNEGETISITDGIPTWNSPAGYVLTAFSGQFNPADATTYYFGSVAATRSTGGSARVSVPRGGTIRRVMAFVDTEGTLGSNETSTLYLRVANSTDHVITSAFHTDSVGLSFTLGSTSIDISTFGYFEIKWVAPTYATNPTNVNIVVSAYIT